MIHKYVFPILMLMAAPAWAATAPDPFALERGHIAATPQELPVLQSTPAAAEAPPVSGTPLPVVQ